MSTTIFGERLAELRKEQRWNQQELADRLKISRSAVGMYEQGRRNPDFALLDNVAELFDVDLNYLLGFADERGHFPKHEPVQWDPNPYTFHQLDSDQYEVIKAYTNATEELKAAVRRVLGIDR